MIEDRLVPSLPIAFGVFVTCFACGSSERESSGPRNDAGAAGSTATSGAYGGAGAGSSVASSSASGTGSGGAPPIGVYPDAAWELRSPTEVGIDSATLGASRDYVGGRGCVVRGGYMAYQWGDQAERADVASAAKPWYGHLLFAAIEKGLLNSEDDLVADFEPGLSILNASLD